jgi:hypothetical protein
MSKPISPAGFTNTEAIRSVQATTYYFESMMAAA